MENWNDDRLDELSRRVDDGFKEMRDGFARIEKEMKEGFSRVDAKFNDVDAQFDRLGGRIDKLFYIQFAFMGSLIIALISVVVGLLTDKL